MKPYISEEDETRRAGGASHGELVQATRSLLDAVSAAEAPASMAAEARAALAKVTEMLAPYAVPRVTAPAGNRPDLPGEGHPLHVPSVIESWAGGQVRGTVTFTRAHDGGRGAVHGGFLPLLYDDVLGRLASRAASQSRTAFLHVDYRAITPVGVELALQGRIDRVEGRKLFVSGEVLAGEVVCNVATALFVTLRPGQP